MIKERNPDGTFVKGLVYGVGVDDIDETKESIVNGKRQCKGYYSVWKNMLKRCYHGSGEYLGKVYVCESWHKLSNFKEWYDSHHIEGYSLDKDLHGGKIYSPDHCVFIPQKLNTFITNINNRCGSYYDKERRLYQSYTRNLEGKRVNIGRFTTEDEAIFYAKTCKILELNRLLKVDNVCMNIRLAIEIAIENIYCNFIKPFFDDCKFNLTFLDTGGVFKKYDNGYDLSIVNLRDYV